MLMKVKITNSFAIVVIAYTTYNYYILDNPYVEFPYPWTVLRAVTTVFFQTKQIREHKKEYHYIELV